MDTEIQVVMEQNKRLGEKMDNVTNQLDKDRHDIDQLRIDQATIREGQQAILNQMTDFKKEIRQIVEDTIHQEVPKAVKKAVARELTTIKLRNPKKVIERYHKVFETIINLFKK